LLRDSSSSLNEIKAARFPLAPGLTSDEHDRAALSCRCYDQELESDEEMGLWWYFPRHFEKLRQKPAALAGEILGG